MKTGWEIKPLGWVAIFMLAAAVVIYFTFFHNKTNKQKTELRIKANVDNG